MLKNKVKSLRDQWGHNPKKAFLSKPPQYSVNLTTIIQEMSKKDEPVQKIGNLSMINKPTDQQAEVSKIIDDQKISLGNDTLININTSSLIDSQALQSPLEDSESYRSSIITQGSNFNNKCQRFQSALRKIDIDNFVIHSKVDEFLEKKKEEMDDKVGEFDGKVEGKENSKNGKQTIHQSCADIKEIIMKNRPKGVISAGKKRSDKFIYKQLEKDCKQKLQYNSVYQQMNQMLRHSIDKIGASQLPLKQSQFSKSVRKSDYENAALTMESNLNKKKVTIPQSPKSHLKERIALKEEQVGKSQSKNELFMGGKTSANFKARSLNKKILNGPIGLSKMKEKPNTQFMEFDLSYKKMKKDNKENNGHTNQN